MKHDVFLSRAGSYADLMALRELKLPTLTTEEYNQPRSSGPKRYASVRGVNKPLQDASGLWADPLDVERLWEVRVFMQRPWRDNPCTMDDVIMHCVKWHTDPVPILMLARASGELDEPMLDLTP